jgi:conjugative relaxase-like TrwC/TraI family protein
VTGGHLTPRSNDDRTVGYDFNFHAPKSVSILYSQTQDARIVDAFRSSVDETMRELETVP